jgi:hypothetical protein
MGGGNSSISTGSAAPNDDEVVFNGHWMQGFWILDFGLLDVLVIRYCLAA